MPAGSLGSYSKPPLFFPRPSSSKFWALTIRLDSGPPGFEKKARGAGERNGAVTGQPCQTQVEERNDPSHGRQIRLAVGRNTQGLERVVSDLAVARDLAIIAASDAIHASTTRSKPIPPETRAV